MPPKSATSVCSTTSDPTPDPRPPNAHPARRLQLHPLDDYPIHQSPLPISHTVSDSPVVYDRFFFNEYTADGSVFFAVAFGVYPNLRVMGGAFSVIPRLGSPAQTCTLRACARTTRPTRRSAGSHRYRRADAAASDHRRRSSRPVGRSRR